MSEELELESATFSGSMEDVAALYGKSLATVRRWKGKGLPIFNPEKMADAWQAKKDAGEIGWKVPERLNELRVEEVVEDVAVDVMAMRFEDLESEGSVDLAVEIARKEVAMLWKRYEAAGTEKVRDGLQSKLHKAISNMRILEKEAPTIAVKAGGAWDKQEVTRELAPMVHAVAIGLRNLWRTIEPKVVAAVKAGESAEGIYEEELDRVFRRLKESKYLAE